MRDRIFQIIEEEFSSLVTRIQSDFVTNFKAKQNNFLLKELDTMMSAHMVFVSSFESKSGNSIQKVAKEIAKFLLKKLPRQRKLKKLIRLKNLLQIR